jgi:hypothetical protein
MLLKENEIIALFSTEWHGFLQIPLARRMAWLNRCPSDCSVRTARLVENSRLDIPVVETSRSMELQCRNLDVILIPATFNGEFPWP